jgi:hypothetical protein
MASHITVQVYASRRKNNDHIQVDVKALFGIVKLRFKIPILQFKGMLKGLDLQTQQTGTGVQKDGKTHITPQKMKESVHDLDQLIKHTFQFSKWVKSLLSHIKCNKLRWDTRIGVGDAAQTAVATGVIWGLKASLIGYICQYIRLETNPRIYVSPQFNDTHFSTEALCIANIRTGYAISAGLLLLYRIVRVKGGLKTWKNILFKA